MSTIVLHSALEDVDYSLIGGLLRGIKPDPILKVPEWAEQRRRLPETSAEPGPFRNSRTPYLVEIGNKLSATDKSQKIIFKKSSQVGATELGNNWCGYTIDVSQCGMLYIMPTAELMKITSKTRIQPMIDATPSLKEKIPPSRSKEGGNTMMTKEFPGGFLHMIGANSPVGLSSIAVRRVYGDETDRYPGNVGEEGDVISLAETRTISFGDSKKIFLTSTPTLKGKSIIDNEFESTGQRYYHVPCPHCGTLIVLKFDQLRYEVGKFDQVYYECQECRDHITERHKTKMLQHGEWIPLFPEKEDGITFGYHINALYSPVGWYGWSQMAREYEKAQTDLAKKITFVNTKLGEVYEAEGDSPEWETIYNKRENYKLNTPNAKVCLITAGVDIQKDRIEVEIVGWGKGKECWSLDYRVLIGNTETASSPVWEALGRIVSENFVREDGALIPLSRMAVDSGYNTSIVYTFSRKYPGKVIPTKGQDEQILMVSPPRSVDTSKSGKKINGVKVWNVGTSMIKTEIYGVLKLQKTDDEPYPIGYCHFPQYDQHYFKGLTSEKMALVTNKKGAKVYSWIKEFERNEPLDCRVYARAAAYVEGMDRWTDEKWDQLLVDSLDLIPSSPAAETKKNKKNNAGSDYWRGR
ncbi:MAG: phage terminase large subunit family protein [Sphingobacteriaceae bacterium]|nr:phage terminase large subunit family protein [Sphingobacteriaceae bacterium]